VDAALRAIVRSYEYEDWPRERIVFDRSRDLFVLYADRKLLTPATIARIETQFHLPPGPHRSHKRLALPEHRDAERGRMSAKLICRTFKPFALYNHRVPRMAR
jgi:hypothetical protein